MAATHRTHRWVKFLLPAARPPVRPDLRPLPPALALAGRPGPGAVQIPSDIQPSDPSQAGKEPLPFERFFSRPSQFERSPSKPAQGGFSWGPLELRRSREQPLKGLGFLPGALLLWEAFCSEHKRFDMDTLRVPNRSPTPISKSNDSLGQSDDIWGARGPQFRPILGGSRGPGR